MKTALVTGASSGIGAAAARHLALSGHRVILLARRQAELDEIAKDIGPNATSQVCDASSGDQVLAFAQRIRDTHGTPDVIVHCAGAGAWKSIEATSPAEALSMMQAPYLAAFNITHAFMRGMLERRSGVVIHVNSPASVCPWRSSVGYASARWALRGLHEALSQDLVGTGVTSCHVVFGTVTSAYFDRNGVTAADVPAIAATVRTMTADECGRLIARYAAHPVRDAIHPFLLRTFFWLHRIAPGFVRSVVRVSRGQQ